LNELVEPGGFRLDDSFLTTEDTESTETNLKFEISEKEKAEAWTPD
jgi:hypothetical protein